MYSIGIDLGGTNIAVGLCDGELNIIEKKSVPTLASRAAEEIVKDMATVSRELSEKHSVDIADIEFVGILVPGSIDREMGCVGYTPNIPSLSGHPLVESFKSYFPVSAVYIENDANAAALGELLKGASVGLKSLVMITLGTGVGGGIILDGKIFSGTLNSHGAELGHTVICYGGRECGCGRRGCFEAYASATALKRITAERRAELIASGTPTRLADVTDISARTAFDLARGGDAGAQSVVDEYIGYLAAGITNMINIFQPEAVLIGGGVSGEGENLLKPLRAIIDTEEYNKNSEVRTKILTARLGNDAGIIGAAALGR